MRSAIYFGKMPDPKHSVLDKAETIARRILERLGSKVDLKLSSASEHVLSPHVIGDLASRLENVVESNLQEDEQRVRRVAPNRFKVLFTYEETSGLSSQYIEAVGKELTATVSEYITNRRYLTRGPIEVEATRDLFGKTTTVKVATVNDARQAAGGSDPVPEANVGGTRCICFDGNEGRHFRVELKPDGAPAYIGRVAGNAMRIDDPSVSRLHCSLSIRTGGSIAIADVGSANGTYVNEQLLGPDEARSLDKGDVVGIGDFKLTVSEIT